MQTDAVSDVFKDKLSKDAFWIESKEDILQALTLNRRDKLVKTTSKADQIYNIVCEKKLETPNQLSDEESGTTKSKLSKLIQSKLDFGNFLGDQKKVAKSKKFPKFNNMLIVNFIATWP